LEMHARDVASTAPYQAYYDLTYEVTSGTSSEVTSATLMASPANPQAAGTAITLTVSSTGSSNPQYRFYVKPTGGTWSLLRNYSSTNTYTWTPSTAGTYYLEMHARDVASTAPYQAYYDLTYEVTSGTSSEVTSATLMASPASPQAAGTAITLTASSTGSSNPQYRFYVKPAGGTWSLLRNYSSTNTYTWTPSTAGTYYLEMHARNVASTAPYQAYYDLTYEVTSSEVTSATLMASPASPQAAGTAITLTASSTGSSNPQYRFYVKPAGGTWSLLRNYSSTNTYTWTPSTAGTYYLEMHARDVASTAPYQAYYDLIYEATSGGSLVDLLKIGPVGPQILDGGITINLYSSMDDEHSNLHWAGLKDYSQTGS